MTLRIDRIPLQGSPLSRAYIENYDQVGRFYAAGPPDAIKSYRAVAERIRASIAGERWDRLLEAARPDQAEIRERVAEIVKGRGLFVATGQQAGLFVSPLFCLYKAFTAARLAAQLEDALGLPVMPLFSVASEDHDWAEVNHTRVIDIENRVEHLSIGGPDTDDADAVRPSIERVTIGPDIDDALDRLAQLTPDTEFKDAVLEPVREAYRPGRPFAAAFESALAHLLRRHHFLVVRTADPFVKRESRQILWTEWQRREESNARLLERSEQLSAAGFEPQVSVAPGTTQLFYEGRLGRDRIVSQGEVARLRRSGETMSEPDLHTKLDSSPVRVSPGALLRPVTEAAVFPVVAYVGGPGEIAYLAQSQVLFELHDVPAPVVVPRAALQLVEPKVARVLEKYDVDSRDLAGDATAAVNRLLDERTPPELDQALRELRRSVTEGLERVEAAAIGYDPGSKSAVGSGKGGIFASIKTLEGKLHARVREKNQVMRQQLEKAAVNLYPEGRPQERMLTPYPYLIRYGESLLEDIFESVVTPLD